MCSRTRTGRIAALVASIALLTGFPVYSADRSLEYAVKATFLYKFATFVEWPAGSFESDVSPFNLCVVGGDPFGGKIRDAVSGQSVGKHPIVLFQFAKAESRSSCHAMLIAGSASQPAAEALSTMSGTPTLTITDSALGPHAGIIHFVIVDDHVSFDIDKVAAARNRLVISSNLLALAHKVNAPRSGVTP